MDTVQENTAIRRICRDFLNTEAGGDLDPLVIVDELLDMGVIEAEDAEYLRSESNLPKRQFYFFLQLLPWKSPELIWRAADIIYDSNLKGSDIFYKLITTALDAQGPVAKYLSFRTATSESSIDGEEVCVATRVNQVTVAFGESGSAGDQVSTPEGLRGHAEPVLEDQAELADIQVSKILGRGSYGVVYAGVYKNQQVAVKKCDYDTFGLALFTAEIEVMKKLDHKNLVKLIAYVKVTSERQLWIILELIPGGSLRGFCAPYDHDISPLSLHEKLKISSECWQGLAYLHGRNCCHKDLSPNNILVSDDLILVKIADFGLSEFKASMVTVATKGNTGTPMYTPPEFASAGPLRHPIKSDVYSMGASLCELFSEQWFWHFNDRPRDSIQVLYQLMRQKQNVDSQLPPIEPDCWQKVPEIVKSILWDAIYPDYKKRKTANELRQMTDDLLKSL